MREKAQREPEEYTTMIVDGMDQSKTAMPRMVKDKDLASLNRLQVHLTGETKNFEYSVVLHQAQFEFTTN